MVAAAAAGAGADTLLEEHAFWFDGVSRLIDAIVRAMRRRRIDRKVGVPEDV